MIQPSGTRKPRVHFSGIGGTAMVAGARLAIEAGWEVRGSDNPLYPPTAEMVQALGVPVATHYAAENLDWGPDLVVIGNVLSRGNPEVEAALDRGLHYLSLPEWLKDNVLRQRCPVVICGTHGKTTTTALTAHLLDRCGRSPGFLVGGRPLDFLHPARLGAPGAPFVIEGDEYDTAFFDKRAKFLHYLPHIAVVTSIEFDHGDIYASLDEIHLAFQRLLRQIPQSGRLIACADNAALALKEHAYCQIETYGFAEHADWRGESGDARGGCQRMAVFHGGQPWAELECTMTGQHNLHNTLAAVAVAARLGASPDAVAEAVRSFKGVRRRMEVFLEAQDITFVDDFAHHPTAVRETIAAARIRWPGRRLRVVFEPRSNTTVTNEFQEELSNAFRAADEVLLGPIYRAERIPDAKRLDRHALIQALHQHGVRGMYSDEVAAIAQHLVTAARHHDVVLILSNGAFGGLYAILRDAYREDRE